MARPPDLAARAALLDDVVGYLATHGLALATLRPMATALGTTPTRLMHHFGSKGELITAALDRVEADLLAIEQRWVQRNGELTEREILGAWWRWMLASPRNLAITRLVVEAASLDPAITGIPSQVRAAQVGNWRARTERRLLALGIDAESAYIQATVLKSAFTGLTVDLVSGGDRRRLGAVLDVILDDHERRVDELLGRARPRTGDGPRRQMATSPRPTTASPLAAPPRAAARRKRPPA